MDVNAKGTFLVVQAVLPVMKAQGYGRICNIASIGGKHSAPSRHYSASKAAVMGFRAVLAQRSGRLASPRLHLPQHHPDRYGAGEPGRSGDQQRLEGQDRHGPYRRTRKDVVGPVAFFCSDDFLRSSPGGR